ncbi:MAG: hypothetical protein RIG62_18315 [Cyclobacteriaceae bacterium]
MTRKIWVTSLGLLLLCTPTMAASALQDSLYNAYNKLSPQFSAIASGMSLVAGLGAMIYVCIRIYRQILMEEPINFYPLVKPILISLALALYPGLLSIVNAVMAVASNYTASLVGESNETLERMLTQDLVETDAWKHYMGNFGFGDYGSWVEDNEIETSGPFGIFSMMNFAGEQMLFQFKGYARMLMFDVVSLLYYTASVCIDAARIFFLLILSLLGPIAIALSLFESFSSSLTGWLTRYIHVSLWLPVANLYGFLINEIQISLIDGALVQLNDSGTSSVDSTDMAMLVFLLFAAVGYFTIPSVASWIVHPGHGGSAAMKQVNFLGNTASAAAGAAMGYVTMAAAAGAAGKKK